ncbi:ubiquitin C-terminal hydrolase-like protein [Xylogone sp. PMI_703]|nr:ubiquitin C-terminal hydrolase-like protein [Xylogone sp. PMI_703]
MDYEPAELSRERAASSEPCATRPNPFDHNEHAARKRQRVSGGGSRSRSVDTAPSSDLETNPGPRRAATLNEGSTTTPAAPPRTPPSSLQHNLPPEPTSSRVTINLRTARPLDAIPSSPSSLPTPSKIMDNGEEAVPRIDGAEEAASPTPAPDFCVETPQSSASGMGSPPIELVAVSDDESDFAHQSPPLAIIQDDEVFVDPMTCFPYNADGEPLSTTVRRLVNFLQYENVDSEEPFVKLRDWIERFLAFISLDNSYECFVKYREFWLAFPDVPFSLSWRSRFFGSFLQRSREGRQALSDFLCQFARLTARFLTMDIRTLSYYNKVSSDKEPDLASRGYLFAYGFLLRKEDGSHIGRNLETHYRWNWDDDVLMMTSNFQAEGGSLQAMKSFVDGLLPVISTYPKFIDYLTEPCRLVAKMVTDAATLWERSNDQQYLQANMEVFSLGFDFFKAMAATLDSIIEKHVTCLTPDSVIAHLTSLTQILRQSLFYEVEGTKDILQSRKEEHPELTKRHMPRVISTEWKFKVLHKLITSAQMQLRVAGVTTMCQDLLSLYQSVRAVEPTSSPLLLYFSNFVLQNKLVDYIVGTGSHPEIINESNNILGFLIVTKTYTTQLTDTIWQTVVTSQDPRVVEAILLMVRRCLNLYDYQALLHICKKVSSLSLETFTLAMRGFCESLFRELIGKSAAEGFAHVDAPPYDLCVRLMRESSSKVETSTICSDIQNFAAIRLHELLGHGPPSDVRSEIYVSCIEDISARTPTAPGSICALNALLRQNMVTDLRILTTMHGLTKLVIEELESTMSGDPDSSAQSLIGTTAAGAARRELLIAIIVHEPGTISEELASRLWDLLVGSGSRSLADRESAWEVLNTASKKTSIENPFIAYCYRESLPHLSPEFFTIGTLNFVHYAIISWISGLSRGGMRYNDAEEDGYSFQSDALDHLWRMILTAPPNTIDTQAIQILNEIYLDSPAIISMPRSKSRELHLALVNRCLDQMADAASKLRVFSKSDSEEDDSRMMLVADESQFQEQELMFSRSLAVLREFLRAYQLKSRFATPKKSRSPIVTGSSTVEGEPLTVKYQSFDGNKHTEVKSLTLGKLNTAASLLASLQQATGFKNYKIFCGGKEFSPDSVDICKSLEDLNLNGLVLVQRRDDGDSSGILAPGIKSSLEEEITRHFDELWGYLSLHEKVAREIYYFLIQFPVYGRLLEKLESQETPYTEIFPLGQPFKCLYAIHALGNYVSIKAHKGQIEEDILGRAIELIVSAISNPDILEQCPSQDLRDFLAINLIDRFLQFLREPNISSTVVSSFGQGLVERLIQLLLISRSATSSPNSVHLTWRIFEVMLEASVHNPLFWAAFKGHLTGSPLFQNLLLEDPRTVIRKSVYKQISNKCSFSPSHAQVTNIEFISTFWALVVGLIPISISKPTQCEETLGLGLSLLKNLPEASNESVDLSQLIVEWGHLLIDYESKEVIGHPEAVDGATHGLANLLYQAASLAQVWQQPLNCGNLAVGIFQKHLFPGFREVEEVEKEIVPVLNTMTRHLLSETIYLLVKDDERQYRAILQLLGSLVPYENGPDSPYSLELTYQFDRTKSVRSSTGYVGLKNLSNTCYLNSLFTQLFMNIPFREFIMNARVQDTSNFKLLGETQKLFGFMQNSLARYVDPTNLAASIRTYEDTHIDVSIQMDVDEFYNLIFDRWEGQIIAADVKRQFRSFYGGQLVQQVKSKECPHISERLEPFSAIQCDIKGKSSLQESLQAYVDGEIMEGDNKYKCSTCDRHVDAVKRACLKDVPDNLIFHLKRFDFNLRTLQRSKINDYFSFPKEIDMRPYKVEHLMNTPDDSPEDIFELVGILIHSGTAESGHYYSYIRERPSSKGQESWVEFNDDNVTTWDPANLEGSCFGGADYRGPAGQGNLQFDKSYSAYMLFYQRSSVVAAQKQALEESHQLSPVRLQLSHALSSHIAAENENMILKYSLYDPSHIPFVIKMLNNMKHINGGKCSESHILEKQAITMALNHLDQVVARTKELPDFPTFMVALKQIFHGCGECSRDFLEWFCDCPEALRHLLIRNPDAFVRSETASTILGALIKVKNSVPYAYGMNEDEDNDDSDPHVLVDFVKTLDKMMDIFHTSIRAWPEYFGVLSSIADLGKPEAVLLLDMGFLRKCLDIICADPNLPSSAQISRMLTIISKRNLSRPVSYDAIISLAFKLLRSCDDTATPCADYEQRVELALVGATIPFTTTEHQQLMQHWIRSNSNIFVEKLLHLNQNEHATRRILIILLHWQENIDNQIFNAIIRGIKKDVASASFLRAALVYCENSEHEDGLARMVEHVIKICRQIDNTEGREFLQFFRGIFDMESTPNDISTEEMYKYFLQRIPEWAPSLLTYYDASVRADTEDFLTGIIFNYGSGTKLGDSEDDELKAKLSTSLAQALGIACLRYLDDTYIRARQQVIRASLLSIYSIIDTCVPFYDVPENEDEVDDTTQDFRDLRNSVLPNMKKWMVEEVDEDGSEWEASEGEYGSSEPMESINELSLPADSDLNDTEVQL